MLHYDHVYRMIWALHRLAKEAGVPRDPLPGDLDRFLQTLDTRITPCCRPLDSTRDGLGTVVEAMQFIAASVDPAMAKKLDDFLHGKTKEIYEVKMGGSHLSFFSDPTEAELYAEEMKKIPDKPEIKTSIHPIDDKVGTKIKPTWILSLWLASNRTHASDESGNGLAWTPGIDHRVEPTPGGDVVTIYSCISPEHAQEQARRYRKRWLAEQLEAAESEE